MSTQLLSPPLKSCPLSLSQEQVAQFQEDGYIALAEVLDAEEVVRANEALGWCVDSLRAEAKVLKNGYGQVWASSENKLKVQFQKGHEPLSASDPEALNKVRKFHDFVDVNPYLTHLARAQEKIQGVLASLLGSAPILSQDMALVNPPGIGTGKPWHQDDAYFQVAPLEAVCGVWISLDEATVENGCMHMLRGWNKLGPLRHFHGADCEIVHDRLQGIEPVPVPLPPGGAIFFVGTAPHMTLPNLSDRRRRALQFHYRSQDSQILEPEAYDALFVEADGTPASCAAASRRGF